MVLLKELNYAFKISYIYKFTPCASITQNNAIPSGLTADMKQQLNSRAQTAIGFMFAQQTRRQRREYCFMRFLRAVALLTSAMCTHTLV